MLYIQTPYYSLLFSALNAKLRARAGEWAHRQRELQQGGLPRDEEATVEWQVSPESVVRDRWYYDGHDGWRRDQTCDPARLESALR